MIDSTCAVAAPPAPPKPPASAPGQPPEGGCNDSVRSDLARLVELELPGITTTLLHGDPWGLGRSVNVHPAVAQLVQEAMPVIARLCRDGRLVNGGEVVPFRFLAARCAHASVDWDVAGQAVSNAAEAVVDALLRRAHELDDLFGAENVEAGTAVLCGILENFAARGTAQVEQGYAAYAASLATEPQDPAVYMRTLDYRTRLSAKDNASRAVLVMVATGHRDDPDALAAAAREIEVHLPGAVDVGLGDATPTHRRVVVPVSDDAALRAVHPILRHIAVAYGVVIVTRPPVSGLSALRACYRDLCGSLREMVRDAGRRSGMVGSPEDTPMPDAPVPVAA